MPEFSFVPQRLRRFLAEEEWAFASHERAVLPGSPASPDHPNARRVAYGAVAVLLGLTGGLGTALVSVNTAVLGGALGLDPAEVAWLSTAYVMANTPVNLLLIKFRQQFGLRPFTLIFLGAYALVAGLHLLAHGFWSAVLVRAASGMAGAAVSSVGLYYMMQALPARWRLKAIVLGVGVPQCATPLARLFSPDLLAMSQWRALYLFELGLTLLCLAAIGLLRLPPSERRPAFEPLDFVTFALLATASALVAAVLGLGRIVWWTNAAWIGWALAAAVPLFLAGIVVEHGRANPLINTRWLGSADIVRFAVVTVVARVVLSEQTYGAVGLLTALGQTNDQFGTLFTIVFAASVAGVALSAVTLDPERLTHPVMLAIGLVAVAAWWDSHSTSLTRAPQLYASQALIAFAATFFIGPSLLFGMTRALKQGTGHVISFFVLFNAINGLGGLVGPALLGSYQAVRARVNGAGLAAALDPTDPLVAARLAAGGQSLGRVLPDPALRGAEGGALLSQATSREAAVLAYDDVFRLIALLAAATTLYLLFLIVRRTWRARRALA